MTDTSHHNDLVTLTSTSTEFEAHTVLAALREEGIEAFAFGSVQSAFPLQARLLRVPVQVRRADLERAKHMLQHKVPDSIDLDWETADLINSETRLPLIVRIGFAVGILALFAMAVATVLIVISLF